MLHDFFANPTKGKLCFYARGANVKTSNLFSEKGILMSAGYLHILQLAQQTLDAISDGDPDRLRTLSHGPVMRFGDAPTKSPWDDN